MPVISALGKWMQEGPALKVLFSYKLELASFIQLDIHDVLFQRRERNWTTPVHLWPSTEPRSKHGLVKEHRTHRYNLS